MQGLSSACVNGLTVLIEFTRAIHVLIVVHIQQYTDCFFDGAFQLHIKKHIFDTFTHFSKSGFICYNCFNIKAKIFTIFQRRLLFSLFENLNKVIHIDIAHLLGNVIDTQVGCNEKLLGF